MLKKEKPRITNTHTNPIKSSSESSSLSRSPHPKLLRSVVDSVFPLSNFSFSIFSRDAWEVLALSDLGVILTWHGFWNLTSACMRVCGSEGVFWVFVVGEERIMFWRDRERENKELNGGVLCGQVRVLVVGDSGACVRLSVTNFIFMSFYFLNKTCLHC